MSDEVERSRAEAGAGEGRIDEAIAALQHRVDRGDARAAFRLAKLWAERGDIDRAIDVLRPHTGANRMAAYKVAELLAHRGRTEELAARATAGDPFSAQRLTGLLAERGDVDGAIEVARPQAAAGASWAPWRLAWLLADRGDIDEAIDVIRPLADADEPGAQKAIDLLVARRPPTT